MSVVRIKCYLADEYSLLLVSKPLAMLGIKVISEQYYLLDMEKTLWQQVRSIFFDMAMADP